jgi:hypothetical protein
MSQLISSFLLALAIAAALLGSPVRPVTTPAPGRAPGPIAATPVRQAAPAAALTPVFRPIATPAAGATPDRWIPERPPAPCPFPACFGPDGRPSSASRSAR